MGWTFLVDRGGTFTDVVARAPDGRVHVSKLLSADVGGVDPVSRAIAGRAVDELRLGTTVATNALLERRGERVLLLVTKGFGDLLEIGTQQRPDLFALRIEKRAPLHAATVELHERVLADGTVERPLDEEEVERALAGWSNVAVLLLHSWINPAHELLVERVARRRGVAHVTLSHRASPGLGAVDRGDTTVADAFLTPALRASVGRIDVGGGRVLCMQSSGGLVERSRFTGKDAILSGPAGGVVAVARMAHEAGIPALVGLDMGGTSTDVCRFDGEHERVFEDVIGGVHIRAPMLRLVTVAAGGGSILRVADGRFQVGPDSAGADPGPACYGRGGPATVTDANVVLGRIRAEHFPHLRLDLAAARARLAAFGHPEEAAAGFLRVAVEAMAAAIREIGTARGHDVRDDALTCFGGAAPQHACALARALDMRAVLVHPLAGVLSAHGLGLATLSQHEVAPVLDPEAGEPPFPVERAAAALAAQGCRQATLLRSVDARYAGTDTALTLPWSPDWKEEFARRHRQLFGFVKDDCPVELLAARVDALGLPPDPPAAPLPERPHRPRPLERLAGLSIFRRADLRPGALLDGPALVVEDHCTTLVEPGWQARVDGHHVLVLTPLEHAPPPAGRARPGGGGAPALAPPRLTARRDPVTLEVMSNRFASLATRMGEHLRRTAHSTNIKERLDFSCALFDARGALVANAPHVPVHLGAMGETVAHLLGTVEMRPGDAWLSNDPYHGGSHLPDLTVVSPVFRDGRLAGLVANRGHHADIGGRAAGSMPEDSRTLAEEGALFERVLLLRDGRLRTDEVCARLAEAGVRDAAQNVLDLSAQVAANVAGARMLDELCARSGSEVVAAWMQHVQDNAAEVMADVVAGLSDGAFADTLDDGSRIAVSITVRDGRAHIDFAGTSGQHPGNRNAPRAVTLAAVLYVFRTLAARPIPLNAGCLRPLDVAIPAGSLLDPRPPAAVAGGNVETSQRIVDVLYGALGRLAASQGTMNNVTFGDERFGFYETVCGGAGAGKGFDGASAVHTHMTNTRITDPEVLEVRHPVIVRRFAVRRGSGGKGVWRGGDGVVRQLQFRRPLAAQVLAERRRTAPFGLRAGPGKRGRHCVGEHGLVLLTPGGGGYSPSAEEWAAMEPPVARRLFREGRWTGTTDGVASAHRQLWLLVVHRDDVGAAREALVRGGHRIVHEGAPGARDAGRFGEDVDLGRDLPLYAERAPSFDGRAGAVRDTSPHLELGAHDVALLLAPSHEQQRALRGRAPVDGDPPEDDLPPLPLPHRAGAPGRRLLTDLPLPGP